MDVVNYVCVKELAKQNQGVFDKTDIRLGYDRSPTSSLRGKFITMFLNPAVYI